MKLNENTAIYTPNIVLVPYDAHHVERYHKWMLDEALREATASSLLSLEEEYENQQSWRTSSDKLTFIITRPQAAPSNNTITAHAAEDIIGDINLFLTPDEEDEDAIKGEIDIMIANAGDRRRGLGESALRAFLMYLGRNMEGLMREFAVGKRCGRFVVKIHQENGGSVRLFEKMGFVRVGEADYFGELTLVRETVRKEDGVEGYLECVYDRSRMG